ncbi:MAG: DNA polymerase III subunit delta [Deltaproteobacteria bacterium]|jgi:DNA polymerase III delta subunit|nr:DNA polymerase III subunit delta [Deltaproteobacteria bacterium]
MDPLSFQKEIVSESRKTFYLINGTEPGAVALCLEAARKAVSPAFFQLNFRKYHAEELNKNGWNRLAGELATNPFGEPPRVVMVRLTEGDKFSSDASEVLTKLRPKINPATSLVMVVDSIPDERFKFFKQVVNEGLEVDCRPPVKGALPQWLVEQFASRQTKLTLDGAKAMIERVGDNALILAAEAEKLSIFPGSSVVFGPKEVQQWVSLGPTAEIYELGSPLGAGRLDKALPTLLDLLSQTDPMPLLWAVGTHFMRLLRMKSFIIAQRGQFSDQKLAAVAGVSPGMVYRLKPQLENWSLGKLKKALAALEAANRAMVTSRSAPHLILEELSVQLGLLGASR